MTEPPHSFKPRAAGSFQSPLIDGFNDAAISRFCRMECYLMHRTAASLSCSLLSIILFGCAAADPAGQVNSAMPSGSGFSVREVRSGSTSHNYSIFIPAQYDPDSSYPAIVFLHGLGEGGTDGVKCTTVGLGPAIARRAQSFPFIAIFPQVRGDWKAAQKQRLVMDVIADVKRNFAVDPDRVALTGLSVGGEATWRIGAAHPEAFSALVPLCAYAAYDAADTLAASGVAIWCFHNRGDPLVPSGGSKEMARRINRAGGNVRYTEFGSLGHNCWNRAYDDELFDWLLQQRRVSGAGGR